MIFKDICYLFPQYSNNADKLFYLIFNDEIVKYHNDDWEANLDSKRREVQKITTRDTKLEPPERLGVVYKIFCNALKNVDFIKYREYIDKTVLPEAGCQELTAFILEKIKELKTTINSGSLFSVTLERLETCIDLKIPYASSVAFLILVIYAIYGKNLFHRHFSWIYHLDDKKSQKLYLDIFADKKMEDSYDDSEFSENLMINLRQNINYFGYTNEQKIFEDKMNAYHTVFLYGMGGIGKTEFAKQYAFSHKKQYSKILFLTYETNICNMLINEQFPAKGIVRQFDEDGKPEPDEAYSKRKLDAFIKENNKSTLLIIDNFDTSYDPMLKEFLAGSYSVVITTRNDWSHLRFPVIELKGLDKEAQERLFCTYYTKTLSDKEQKLLPELLTLLYGHPLTIQLTASLMKRRVISISKMIEILQKDGITPELKGTVSYGFENADTLYHHIRKLFKLDSLSKEERQVLIHMTLLPVEGFDIEKFMKLSKLTDSEPVMLLADGSWILYHEKNNDISLHPLIADVVKQELCLSMESADVFLQQFSDITDNTWGISASEKYQYSEIALQILRQFPNVNSEYLKLYRNIAILVMRTEHFDLSSKLLQECLDCTRQIFGENSKETAEFYYYIADNLVYTGNLTCAAEYIDKTIAIMEIFPLEIRTAYYTKYKAWIMLNHVNSENLCEAEQLLAKTHHILEQLPEQTTPDYLEQKASLCTAFSYYHYYIASYETALEYANQAFDIYVNLFGEVHPDTIAPLNIKSLIYSKIGYSEQALSIIQDVIAVQEKIFPEYSQKLLLKYRDLAIIYHNIGQLNDAIQMMQYVCEEFCKKSEKSSSHDIIYADAERMLSDWKNELA